MNSVKRITGARRWALLAVGFFIVGLGVCRAEAPARIGVLTPGLTFEPVLAGLQEGLTRLGLRPGRNLSFVVEDSEGRTSNLGASAAKLVAMRPAVLFGVTTAHAVALKQATGKLPIVFAWVGDPLRSGLIASYSSSGNNLTGVASYAGPLSGKRLEILKEVVPGTKRVLAIVAAQEWIAQLAYQSMQETANKIGVELIRRDASTAEELEKVVLEISKRSVDAIYHVPSTLIGAHIQLLINKSREQRLPLITHESFMVEQGALCSFGGDFRLAGMQAARLVGKILKGETPADIPTEIPDQFLLVVNVRTAKAIGLKIPRKILDKVDRVVE